jgi:hypothetical protein
MRKIYRPAVLLCCLCRKKILTRTNYFTVLSGQKRAWCVAWVIIKNFTGA